MTENFILDTLPDGGHRFAAHSDICPSRDFTWKNEDRLQEYKDRQIGKKPPMKIEDCSRNVKGLIAQYQAVLKQVAERQAGFTLLSQKYREENEALDRLRRNATTCSDWLKCCLEGEFPKATQDDIRDFVIGLARPV